MNGRVKAGTSKAAANARRRSFALAYIANNRNGTQAAIAAGYSRRGADVVAARLLGDARVSALIAELTAELTEGARLTCENVLREVRRPALADPRKLYREDGTLKNPAAFKFRLGMAPRGITQATILRAGVRVIAFAVLPSMGAMTN